MMLSSTHPTLHQYANIEYFPFKEYSGLIYPRKNLHNRNTTCYVFLQLMTQDPTV